jgi:hypothetical protein
LAEDIELITCQDCALRKTDTWNGLSEKWHDIGVKYDA